MRNGRLLNLASLVVCTIILLYCTVGQCEANLNAASVNNTLIYKTLKSAVEYDKWIKGSNYRHELAQYYAGPLLKDIVSSIDNFKTAGTDWYSLTFLQKCHIVYSNEKTAIVLAHINDLDVNSENIIWSRRIFILHNTDSGWRITQMLNY